MCTETINIKSKQDHQNYLNDPFKLLLDKRRLEIVERSTMAKIDGELVPIFSPAQQGLLDAINKQLLMVAERYGTKNQGTADERSIATAPQSET